jgi:DivIVA domain-containing protein
MMWFFAILVVLALGGIAVVASGRGTPMEPAYDDRPDSLVPADGPVTTDDLRRVRFSLAFRGYRMSEVDALLERLADEREAEDRRALTAEPETEPPTEPPTPAPAVAAGQRADEETDAFETADEAVPRHRP